jgi:hypothetical protein
MNMKGGIIMTLGFVLIVIVVIMLFAVVMCNTSANEGAFYCTPFAPLTEMISKFF